MTDAERLAIESQLRAERICAKKVQVYMSASQDSAVQAILQQMAEKGQHHISILNNMLHNADFYSELTQH
ncbi:hypothetical protein [Desulfotruncus alcoholivorax]|uniref:hypothetical protein n=1 Tax=Desulfotruncus alcoholivorax TaxID=265477 RepID=UPI001EE5876C|nr:hypothetical protein [Desulfotruncus alcoholivorax]